MATIAIDARFYGTEHTGLGRYTTNVLAQLPKHLKKHHLVILLRKKYYQTLSFPSNCTKVLFDIQHYSVKEQLLLPLLLSKQKPDLLYSFHFNTPILSRIPRVVTIHDLIKTYFTGIDTTTHAPWLYQLKRSGYNLVVKQTLTHAQDIIVPTNTVKNQILANYPSVKPERIHPIPEAPDNIFRIKNNKLVPLPPSLDLPDKYLLYVGNAYPHKNLQVLLEAFRSLKDSNLHLLIVSKHTPFLARTLAPYEPRNIHVLPELSDSELVSVYQHARALVTPSLMEGYGLVGLESMMVGTPVIASNIPVYREVYQDSVTYFDPQSPGDLANSIKQVLSSPPSQESLINFARTWDDVAKSIAEVLNARCARLR